MHRPQLWESRLSAVTTAVEALRPRAPLQAPAIHRWQADAAAATFHLNRDDKSPLLVCLLGGTGAGKSTILNRILHAELSAADFRRTFTAGAVAVAADPAMVPPHWLGLPVSIPDELPARGQPDTLTLVSATHDLLKGIVLVDTPDLDGDQPAHHAQAERAFRWAEGLLFIVSPEKYQMPELLPYYRMARRYALPAIYVMNKCETAAMLDDYRKILESEGSKPDLFAVPRDDAAYEPPAESNLNSLRIAIAAITRPHPDNRHTGLQRRVIDLLSRLRDLVIAPIQSERRDAAKTASYLQAMERPAVGVDVNPITLQLQRRLQQRIVLYLMGPQRVLDRIRQVPGMLVRLPRTAWDFFLSGRVPATAPPAVAGSEEVPDFPAALKDQFIILQTRIEDAVRATPSGQKWIAENWQESKIDPDQAATIATEELAELNAWLQRRWNATPRDTAVLLRLLKHLPGGEKLAQWTEAAPYLLAIIVVAHHAIFGPVDLMVLGGYSFAAWIVERLSNEVSARTRQANRAIDQRFERLAHDQIKKTIAWIESRTPSADQIRAVESAAQYLQESLAS
ncbi:MAG: hypothetical protein ABSF29_15590 [Tepidisphaeraceae bacterium]